MAENLSMNSESRAEIAAAAAAEESVSKVIDSPTQDSSFKLSVFVDHCRDVN